MPVSWNRIDPNLLPENIADGVDIFWVLWTLTRDGWLPVDPLGWNRWIKWELRLLPATTLDHLWRIYNAWWGIYYFLSLITQYNWTWDYFYVPEVFKYDSNTATIDYFRWDIGELSGLNWWTFEWIYQDWNDFHFFVRTVLGANSEWSYITFNIWSDSFTNTWSSLGAQNNVKYTTISVITRQWATQPGWVNNLQTFSGVVLTDNTWSAVVPPWTLFTNDSVLIWTDTFTVDFEASFGLWTGAYGTMQAWILKS